MSSDGGALLLREADKVLDLAGRLGACFEDHRDPTRAEHSVEALVRQRVPGLTLAYEDLNDHDEIRRDSMLALACGRDDLTGEARARDRAYPLAGSSTLNRMEPGSPDTAKDHRYKKIVAFRVITGNRQPYFTTINEFRRVHREHFEGLFVEVVKLCREAELVRLRHVAVDGTKVKANASRHKAMSYRCLVAEEKRMLAEAEAADGAEDARHGEGVRGDELPEELRRRESRLKPLREAKARLGRRGRLGRCGKEATAAGDDDARVRKGLGTQAVKRRARADELDPPDESPAGAGTEGQPGALPRKETQATTVGQPADGAQANFTDPESNIMKGTDGFVQGYNAQLAVDEEAQVIVAQGVTDQPPDSGNLVPMIERVDGHLDEMPANATADAGYWNPEAEDRARALDTEARVSTRRQRHGAKEGSDSEAEPPDGETDPLKRMRSRLASEEGRALYARRKAVVEPINSQIRHARGFRRFSFRGLEAGGAEWALVCLCHNLLKIFRNRPEEAPFFAPPEREERDEASALRLGVLLFAFCDPPQPRPEPTGPEPEPKPAKIREPAPPMPVNPARRLQPPPRLRPGKRLRRTDSLPFLGHSPP